MIRAWCFFLGVALLGAPLPAQAQAQGWPNRFVRLVIPGGLGTVADFEARLIGQHLSERWGQQVIVENKPGAGGMVGTAHIAQSAPDGYSLLFAQGAPLSLTPHAMKSVPYDVERDFDPVVFAGYSPLVLAASSKLAVASVADLIALAKKQPGMLSFATSSARSIPHLAAEYFMNETGIKMVHVPYVGYPRAIQDTIAGTVDIIFGGAQIIPQRDNGGLRMLGVTTPKRILGYEDVPAIGETIPGYAVSGWVGVMAPKGTPPAIIAKINADMRQVMERPDVVQKLHHLAIYPETVALATPEALAKFIRDDSALMARILKAAQLSPEDAAK